MKNQAHPSVELEEANHLIHPNNINIDDCIEKLQNTVQKIENIIKAIKETWLGGWLIDKPVKQLKIMLNNQLEDLANSSKTKNGYELLELKGEINAVITTLASYLGDPKFIQLSKSKVIKDLNKHRVNIELYVDSLKNQHRELEIENKTLLNAIDENPETQMQIKVLVNTAEAMQANNLQLAKNVDMLKAALDIKMKEIVSLKAKLIIKESALDITKQKRKDVQQENLQLKQNEKLYKEKERQSDIKIRKQLLKNTKLSKENELLKTSEKEIAEQRSAHNYLKYEYQSLSQQVDILSDKVIHSNNEKETLLRMNDKKQEKITELKQRIDELEQAQSNSNRSEYHNANPSHNRHQLFSYNLDVDYHQVGTSNDMQKTLYAPDNY